ncbi:MAG TPA: tetraacyldisaccharide 4'-kinase [Steroidobacteraceae bacterium]|nr:tetraacyldisaccharide 4'-kinase [Steroidobacteraceae bacterium]
MRSCIGCSSPTDGARLLERRLTQLWYAEGSRLLLLQPLAWLFGRVVGLRRRAYEAGWVRAASAGRPVVVIGNLTVGGTGKTPLTLWLAGALSAAGLRVGIVARGYGSAAGRGPRDVRADSRWQDVGDEPLILARRSGCPTVIGSDRVAAARRLALEGVEVILADDGLQHLRLARDCEIAVVDGERGVGNGRLLPAGPLRESAARLRQVDAIVVNGSSTGGSLTELLPASTLHMQLTASEVVSLDEQRRRPLSSWRGERVHAVAGIGNPQRFFRDLRASGLEVIEHAYPDHYPLSAAELTFADALPVLMTEKDAVKCAAFASPRLWYVPVVAQLAPPDAQALLDCVLAKVRAAGRAGGS